VLFVGQEFVAVGFKADEKAFESLELKKIVKMWY